MTTPEGKVKDVLRKRMRAIQAEYPGRLYWFMPVQNGMGAPGLDFYICAGGWFIAIETKTPGNPHLRPRQETTRDEILDAHGLVYVVYDEATIDAAMKVVEACCMLAEHCRLPGQDGPRDRALKLNGHDAS